MNFLMNTEKLFSVSHNEQTTITKIGHIKHVRAILFPF